jgi:hypothetical protein
MKREEKVIYIFMCKDDIFIKIKKKGEEEDEEEDGRGGGGT